MINSSLEFIFPETFSLYDILSSPDIKESVFLKSSLDR